MKRVLYVLLALVIILAACGQPSSSSSPNNNNDNSSNNNNSSSNSNNNDTVTLQIGHALQADHSVDKGANRFAELVEEKTDGEVKVEVFPASQLGNEREMLEQLSIGAIDMGIFVTGGMGTALPELGISLLVYAFRDIDHARNVWEGEIGGELSDMLLQSQNIRVINPFWYYGTNNLTANKEIHSPEDLDGMKIRVPENEMSLEGINAMGAKATPIDYNELYMSLQTGIVDGQENPASTILASSLEEVQDYVMLTEHNISGLMVTISDSVYQELTKEQQEIVIEAAKEAGIYNDEIAMKENEEALKALEEAGMTIIEVDKSKFAPAGQKVAEKYESQWGDLYDRIQAVK